MVLSALDLIPDAWQTGPLNEIVLIGAVLAALAVIVRVLVLPVWRWVRRISSGIETAVDRLSDVPVHDERIDIIERKIEEIVEALRPTNGDRRSISDRLDTVKQQTIANSEQIRELRNRLDTTPEGASS
jgi:cytochrome c-type biogenesis protein CcmH/NrfG